MIIVDKELEKLEAEKKYIRVGLVGAGFFGKAVALQFQKAAKGMHLVAIANRTLSHAAEAYQQSGVDEVIKADSQAELDHTISKGEACITKDAMLLCGSSEVDVIIEATGSVAFGAEVVLAAIRNKKHIIVNAELDATVGPILKTYADRHGVIFTDIDGDQPGVIMNLFRFLMGVGIEPVLCGNIKGLEDHYRTPATQEAFAHEWGQNPAKVTSFADGSKISFEQAVVANATGMKVGKRGMFGPTVPAGTPLEEAIKAYPSEALQSPQGIVDYVVGAAPGPGVFIIGRHEDARQRRFLSLYKMGEGPYYCFHTPFHLCHFEVPNTVARAVLFQDATIAPADAPTVEVITIAKKDLETGEILDGIGHYMTYGVCENVEIAGKENLLPLGVAEGCRLKKDIKKDQALTYDDVEIPEGRLIDQLRKEQTSYFTKQMVS